MRVIVADDSMLVRQGVASLLSDQGFEVVAQVGSAPELSDAIHQLAPDVVVLDIRMPPSFSDEGLRAARAIREEYGSRIGVLILSQHLEPDFAAELIETGEQGVGYLLKDRILDLREFGDAVRRVGIGGTAVDPAVVAQLLRRGKSAGPLSELTERERQVLSLMAEGRSNQAIAERMFLSPKTIEANIGVIFSKLGLIPTAEDHRRVLAVVAYLRSRAQP